MSEQSEQKEATLRIYLGTDRDKIVLSDGKEYILYPLDLTDIGDLEERFGENYSKIATGQNVKAGIYILWLAVRKNYLTEEQILAQQWKISERQVGMWFSIGEFEKLTQIVPRIFSFSGLEVDLKNE